VSAEWTWERATARLEALLAGVAARMGEADVAAPLQPPVDVR
jgi:hypothetical protein